MSGALFAIVQLIFRLQAQAGATPRELESFRPLPALVAIDLLVFVAAGALAATGFAAYSTFSARRRRRSSRLTLLYLSWGIGITVGASLAAFGYYKDMGAYGRSGQATVFLVLVVITVSVAWFTGKLLSLAVPASSRRRSER